MPETLQDMWLSIFLENKPDLIIVIPDVPPSVNNYLVHTRFSTYKTETAKNFQALAKAMFLEVAPHWQCTDQVVGVLVDFRIGDDTLMDVDNHFKVLHDAFNGLIWKDDSQIVAAMGTKTRIKPTRGQRVRDIKRTALRVFSTSL